MLDSNDGMQVGCIDGSIITTGPAAAGVRLRVAGSYADQMVELSAPAAALLIAHLASSLADAGGSGRLLSERAKSAPSGGPASSAQPSAHEDTAPKPKRAGDGEKVVHLIEAGLLAPGASLAMTHHGDHHFAKVTDDGRIIVGEEKFGSPSRACGRIVGGSVNGWLKWRVVEGPYEGRTLADLRWRLRAHRFPPPDARYAASTQKEKRQLAMRWVEHALSSGLDPSIPNTEAVEDLLSGNGYAETTLASYRQHLQQWFNFHSRPAAHPD